MKSLVECRSESEYAENPRALRWEGKRHVIVEILGSWRSPDGKGYRVQTADNGFFDVFYNEVNDAWNVHQIGPSKKGE